MQILQRHEATVACVDKFEVGLVYANELRIDAQIESVPHAKNDGACTVARACYAWRENELGEHKVHNRDFPLLFGIHWHILRYKIFPVIDREFLARLAHNGGYPLGEILREITSVFLVFVLFYKRGHGHGHIQERSVACLAVPARDNA